MKREDVDDRAMRAATLYGVHSHSHICASTSATEVKVHRPFLLSDLMMHTLSVGHSSYLRAAGVRQALVIETGGRTSHIALCMYLMRTERA